MKKNIRAVFWDIDGTMVVSEPVHKAKMEHAAALHNIALPDDVHSKFHGIGDYRAYEFLKELGFAGTMDDFMAICNDYYAGQLDTIHTREGFLEAFALFDQKGIPQGAVSNGTKILVQMNIERTGIGEKLKVVIDLDDVESRGLKPKPFADPYLEALRQVNEEFKEAPIQPHECLVVEDSPTGIDAGKAAGMNTIFWKLTPEKSCPAAGYEAYTGQDLLEILGSKYF